MLQGKVIGVARGIITLIMISVFATAAGAADNSVRAGVRLAQQQGGSVCGWYAIGTCSREPGPAQYAADRIGAYVVLTDTIENFNPGWYCAVIGPQDKYGAEQERNYMRGQGEQTAYIKYGC